MLLQNTQNQTLKRYKNSDLTKIMTSRRTYNELSTRTRNVEGFFVKSRNLI